MQASKKFSFLKLHLNHKFKDSCTYLKFHQFLNAVDHGIEQSFLLQGALSLHGLV